MSNEFEIGTIVTAAYKTGEYVGEIVEISSSGKAAVKIKAVIKHPTQGDLHNPMDPNVPFFHQRRALSDGEIALMPMYTVKPFNGTVQEYRISLERALYTEIRKLEEQAQWVARSLQELGQLKKDYTL
ncbi:MULTISPECIES: sporulation phosphorelay system protein KapB [Paenibacillus]|jgi:kinase-associated protein B|uniref:Kinase-associated lipoprotein B n=1 Tax=Paenibacillus baimaensis TaxID=2982185 RepID=A0ABT2UTL2_9BACL|nr:MULTISPECIES: sporulation phosphorelay system protein KapB [unclassified Paenibacillus]MCU6797963.1 kinase-associated lipoprotein B [Paenibacillus sp. WQ 127069]OMF19919.1 kinase [Paenibacillus sp. FSL H7-0331]